MSQIRSALAPALRVAGTAVAIAAVAGAAIILDQLVRAEARLLIQSELTAVADRAVRNAEAPISAAAQTLVEIARAAPVDCLSATVSRFRERAKTIPAIVAFDVVDASGFLMCSSADEPARPARLLPELSPREPSITLTPDPREDRRGLLVASTIANGVRLVAELAADVPAMPVAPAFVGDRLSVSLSVTERGLWRRTGVVSDDSGALLRGRAESQTYPVVAEAVADAGIVPEGFRRIQLAIIACGGLAAGAILLLGWRPRKPGQPRAVSSPVPKAAPAKPLYRPVIEIETGEVVGVDVVLDGDATGDAVFIEQMLVEMAPALQAHPTLMLSLPRVSTRAGLDQITLAVSRLTKEYGVGAQQIVLATLPGALDAATEKSARTAGARLALVGVLSSEGGMLALASHQPDFIAFGAEVLAGERELAILDAAAGIARKLDIGVVVREVELPEHIERLRSIGVTTASGPVFGYALNARSIAELVAAAAHPQPEARVA